uniref:Uncharacterized protein n=1 Tax=Anopheles atroparvus TaxID=41427 RepID=A0AAG5DV84_ANOAO
DSAVRCKCYETLSRGFSLLVATSLQRYCNGGFNLFVSNAALSDRFFHAPQTPETTIGGGIAWKKRDKLGVLICAALRYQCAYARVRLGCVRSKKVHEKRNVRCTTTDLSNLIEAGCRLSVLLYLPPLDRGRLGKQLCSRTRVLRPKIHPTIKQSTE